MGRIGNPIGFHGRHDWRRFVEFEPYAEVVREYFRMFVASGGNLRATNIHIVENGPYYPDPEVCKPPEGYKVVCRIRKVGKGYCPGRMGLRGILTQAAYVGHWAVNRVIVRWDNHPVIVPKDLFMQAFNYLSPVTLRGQKNAEFRSRQEHRRPSLEIRRTVENPLLSGMLVTGIDGKMRNVGTRWIKLAKAYSYAINAPYPSELMVWSKRATYLDKAVTELVLSKLRDTFDTNAWAEALKSVSKEKGKQRYIQEKRLEAIQTVMHNLLESLETLTSPDMVNAAQARYEDAKTEHERIVAELQVANLEEQQLEALNSLKNKCGPAIENWPNMTREEKRVVLHALIDRIEVSPLPLRGVHIVVWWRDRSSDEFSLSKQASTYTQWIPQAAERLLELVEAGASQLEIAREFPKRRWTMIRNKYYHEKNCGIKVNPKPIRDYESYLDYLKRVGAEPDSTHSDNSLTQRGSDVQKEKIRLDAPG